jgi:hypothetical protein
MGSSDLLRKAAKRGIYRVNTSNGRIKALTHQKDAVFLGR